jgi:hypothetical protein
LDSHHPAVCIKIQEKQLIREDWDLAMPAQGMETTKRAPGKILIREADLQADRGVLIDAFYRYLTPLSDDRRYDWLYRENPDGPARVWIAYDNDEKRIIGSGSAIPRRISVGGSQLLACIMADFWIDPQFRTLGPALQLQRACMSSVDGKGYDLCIDFPKNSMVAVYHRLDVAPASELVRWAKPLRLDGLIRQRVRIPFLVPCLSAAGNLLLKLHDLALGTRGNCEVLPQTDACGEEFTRLSKSVSKLYGVCVTRSADYLNWRYRMHFHHQYSMLTARRDGVLLGYVVYVEDQGFGQIVDLFGVNEPETLEKLVASVVRTFRARGVPLLSAPLMAADSQKAIFRLCGFHPRESVPVVLHAPQSVLSSHPGLGAQKWFLMQGDRES